MDIYDPGTASETQGLRYYGYDPALIKYVGVNSCLTITCIHTEGLWGAHFAINMANNKEISREFVTQTLDYLEEGMPSTKVGTVLLMGPTETWSTLLPKVWQGMIKYAKKWGGGQWRQYNTDNLDEEKYKYMNIYLYPNSTFVKIHGVKNSKETGDVFPVNYAIIQTKS